MLKFQAQTYRINDVVGWHDRRELRLAPEFQRRTVWTPRGKSFLIDSILRGMPLPQFFVREIVLPKEKRTVREVVDGQQRLSAILGYVAGEYTVLPMHNPELARLKYEELPEDVQKAFLSFPLSVNVLQGTEDADLLEIFARLNSYSVPLNQQEKLNAMYVGAFKKAMTDLAKDHLAYWKRHRILTAQPIARMKDVELTCELVGGMLHGLQNQKKIVASMYKEYDDEFPQITYLRPRFAETLQTCQELLGGDLSGTIFQRTSLFYSFYMAVYDCTYGLQAGAEATPRIGTNESRLTAQNRLIALSEGIQNDVTAQGYLEFYEATRQSTDKLPQRTKRHLILKEMIAPAFPN
jgi:hypothetical protein